MSAWGGFECIGLHTSPPTTDLDRPCRSTNFAAAAAAAPAICLRRAGGWEQTAKDERKKKNTERSQVRVGDGRWQREGRLLGNLPASSAGPPPRLPHHSPPLTLCRPTHTLPPPPPSAG